MKQLLARALVRLTGNEWAQRLLERNVQVSQYLMGVGAGTNVDSSGERSVLDLVRARRRAPYRVFDVGANHGQYAQLVLEVFGAGNVDLHCFEPGSHTFELLRASLADRRGVTLNQVALGREPGQAVLHFDAPGSGLASLTARRLDHFDISFTESETVRVTTIDAYCAEHAIDRIDLLKIDVEGHELDVLSGASSAIEQGIIDAVAFEFGGGNIDTRSFLQDFFYLFSEAGMRLYRVTPSGHLRPLSRYQEIAEQFRTTNYLAVRSDGHEGLSPT